MNEDTNTNNEFDTHMAMVRELSPYLFCDSCSYYPLESVHGHFVCPDCKMVTKCCEGGPLEA